MSSAPARRLATRRQVLAGSGATAVSIAFAGAFSELFAGTAAARGHSGYGPLVPDPDGLLDLPKGFRYRVLSREGDRLRSGEGPVPSNHDGMAAFAGHRGRVHLVRNHENRVTAKIAVPAVDGLTYDPMGKGGCTALELDSRGAVLGERVAIAGTAVNCAGGRTPWNTWLTCEETEDRAGTNGYTKDHGFIFEVDGADPHRTGAVPLTAMGRFQHEAIAIDPNNGIVYETEDAFEKPFGLFYRFLPEKPLGGTGSLRAGGELQAMRVPGVPDLSVIQETGASFDRIEWVPVPDPQAAGDAHPAAGLRPEGHHARPEAGGLLLGRLVGLLRLQLRAERGGLGGRPLRPGVAVRTEAPPAHPGGRLRPGYGRPAARRVPRQHLPGVRRRADGVRGRQRRAACVRGDAERRGVRDGARRGRTSVRPRSRSGASSPGSRSRRTAGRCT